jgi:hypothetical protein
MANPGTANREKHTPDLASDASFMAAQTQPPLLSKLCFWVHEELSFRGKVRNIQTWTQTQIRSFAVAATSQYWLKIYPKQCSPVALAIIIRNQPQCIFSYDKLQISPYKSMVRTSIHMFEEYSYSMRFLMSSNDTSESSWSCEIAR